MATWLIVNVLLVVLVVLMFRYAILKQRLLWAVVTSVICSGTMVSIAAQLCEVLL